MTKFLPFLKRQAALLLAAMLVAPALAPVNVDAQGAQVPGIAIQPFRAVPVSQTSVAADTDPMLYVKFFGPGGVTSTTTMAVEANGDLTFVVNGAAYAGFECPVSGALGGVIDVSDAACNTLGEVVDIINATAPTFSTGYFRAVIAAGLRSDSSDTRGLADAADTDVNTPNGDVIFYDSSVDDDIAIGLWDSSKGIQNWIPGSVYPSARLPKNPWADSDSVLLYYSENITNAGTVGNIEVHCTTENYNDGKALSSESDRVAYIEAGAATTVTGKIDEFLNAGGLHCAGGKLWVRLLASGADTSAQTVIGTGYRAPLRY